MRSLGVGVVAAFIPPARNILALRSCSLGFFVVQVSLCAASYVAILGTKAATTQFQIVALILNTHFLRL